MEPLKNIPLKIEKSSWGATSQSGSQEATLQSNQQGKILRADHQLAVLTGYTPSKIHDLLLFNIIPDLTGNLLRQWWDTLERQGHFEQRIDLLRANDEMIPVFLMGHLMEESNCFYLRIVEEKSVLSQNPLEVDLFKLGLKHAKTGVWRWELETNVCILSESFYQVLQVPGKPKLTIGGKGFALLLQTYFSQEQFAKLENSWQWEKGDHEPRISHLQRRDNSYCWKAEPIWRDEKVVAIQGSCQDTTPSDSSAINNHLARKLIQESSILYIWVDSDGKIIFINDSACTFLGHQADDCLTSVSVFDIDVETSRSDWEKLKQDIKEGESIHLLSSFQRKNGTLFPVELVIQRLATDRFCLRARDLTQERKDEARLQATLMEVNSLSNQLAAENTYLQEEVSDRFEEIISRSQAYKKVLLQVERVAPTQATVLIEGETGTGKELLARAIHRLSLRHNRPIVKVNCAALPANLIESELFGHERGAFTGADKRRIGRFEIADKGTLFLDEIGEIPLDVQVKLLRVLQEGEFERLGGNQTLHVQVRIIAATNRNLQKMVEEGTFREDLYYRLNVFPIYNIPLRERDSDIMLLATYFVKKSTKKFGKELLKIRQSDVAKIEQYHYPGNIRELENIIERAVILSKDKFLDLSSWKPAQLTIGKTENFKSLDEIQIEHITHALNKTGWQVSGATGAAKLLRINPQTLFSRIKKYGIKRENA